MYCKT